MKSLKRTAIYYYVCFVPYASTAVRIAGNYLAALDSQIAILNILNASGGYAAVAYAVNERECAVVVNSVETAACRFILVNSDFLAV